MFSVVSKVRVSYAILHEDVFILQCSVLFITHCCHICSIGHSSAHLQLNKQHISNSMQSGRSSLFGQRSMSLVGVAIQDK